jgi:hypothetical protein
VHLQLKLAWQYRLHNHLPQDLATGPVLYGINVEDDDIIK